MSKCLMILLMCFVVSAVAMEYPYVPGMKVNLGQSVTRDYEMTKPLVVNEPIWKTLERMALADRLNSEISIELEPDASQAALDMASRIESLWNSGNFNEALALFPELAELTDANQMAIGNAWRTPIPTYEQSWWGNDVRIGNRDSVVVTALDIHRASGNLFAVLLLEGDGNAMRWDVYISTNGGLTWQETYDWWASFDIDISAAVLANHLYIGYAHQTYGRIRRCRASNGTQENFNNGQAYINVYTTTPPDSVNEIALTGNQDFFNNRLYYVSLTKNGNLAYYWSDSGAVNWNQVTTGVTYGERGLDATTNEGYADYFLVVSYISRSDSIYIDGRSTTWTNLIRYPINSGSAFDYTSVGAWRDTLFAAFGFQGPAAYHCRYLTSYNGGTSWFYGNVGGDTTTTSESPDVTLREGGGAGVLYRYYTPTRQERYTWRRYAGGWTTPVSIADREPYYNKPSIEYLGSGRYGAIFTTWRTPIRAAYFDRSDWLEVAEQTNKPLLQNIILAPNPSQTHTQLSYALKNGGEVRVTLFDASGRLINTLVNESKAAGKHTLRVTSQDLPAGVYFLQIETPDGVATKTMTIVK